MVQARKCLKAWKANEALAHEISSCESQLKKENEMLARVQEEADKLAAEAAAAAAAEAAAAPEGAEAGAAGEEAEGEE
jgi:hypothetical protein